MQSPKIIGITGNIGSGKSTVTGLFAMAGFVVFNADNAGKIVLTKNSGVVKKIIGRFGTGILHQANAAIPVIDPVKLSQQVFNHPENLQALNGIVHPAVKALFENWMAAQKAKYIVRESALLFETGIYTQSYKNITVSCPFAVRLARALQRGGISEESIVQREKNQLPEAEKIKKSDYVIDNYNQPLTPQVTKIIAEINEVV